MKKTLLTALFIFAFAQLKAQNFEFSLQAGSGLSHFSGSSSASTSYIIGAPGGSDNYTNDPYGSRTAITYSAGLQGQYVFKSMFIVGLQASYQLFQSKVKLDSVSRTDLDLVPFPGPNSLYNDKEPATGQTSLKASYINLSPYIGYRVLAGKIKLDVLPGIDIGFGLGSHENGKATTAFSSNNVTLDADKDLGTPKTDVGLRLGLAAYYHRYGLTASYSYGLSNYLSYVIPYGSTSLHTELFNLGISYKIN
jgi:hypothetical protein